MQNCIIIISISNINLVRNFYERSFVTVLQCVAIVNGFLNVCGYYAAHKLGDVTNYLRCFLHAVPHCPLPGPW